MNVPHSAEKDTHAECGRPWAEHTDDGVQMVCPPRRGPIRRLREWWKSIEGSAQPSEYDDYPDYLRWQR